MSNKKGVPSCLIRFLGGAGFISLSFLDIGLVVTLFFLDFFPRPARPPKGPET